MSKFALGIILGICLILCAAATYKITVDKYIYTNQFDPNDPIYKGLEIHPNHLRRFGNCERTVVFYNITLNRMRIAQLEQAMIKLQKLQDPNSLKEPNEPAQADNSS